MKKYWRKKQNRHLLKKVKLLAMLKIYRRLSFIMEGLNKMANGSEQEKSTGYTQPTKTETDTELVQPKSTGRTKASPVLETAPIKAESINSTGEVSASEILAVQVLMGDFKALKELLAGSWQASSNGKIYWCASMPGHKLNIFEGKLFIDDKPVEKMLEKLLAV